MNINSVNKVALQVENAENILTVGLPYKAPTGGISMVIKTYSDYFPVFNFLSTYKRGKFNILLLPYFFLACLKLSWKLWNNKKIKIVHIHGAAKGSLLRKYIIFRISHLFGKKVIYHSHGSELRSFYYGSNRIIKSWIKLFFQKVDLVICLSEQWREFFVKDLKVREIYVLENIVENPDYNLVKQYKPKKKLTFLFLGQIGQRKGVFDLLEVISEMRAGLEDKFHLIIGGRGETDKLEKYIQDHELDPLIAFAGWITGENKSRLLEKADVYVLPSYNEGLPISILEALSYGLPVISTSVGGIPVVVQDNMNGFIVEPGDKKALSDKINWFINNQEKIMMMGLKSQEIVFPYYAENVIPKLNRIYKKLLA